MTAHEQINEVLFTLTLREQQVLQLRFGLEDGISHTMEDVGKEFNVTRERVRQIMFRAVYKLRHPSRSAKLSGLDVVPGTPEHKLLEWIFGEYP